MIKLINNDWEKILKKPNNYVDDDQDLALVKIVPANNPKNPTLLMVGKDVFDGRFYIVVEDNETSEDIYLEGKETLYSKFMEIYKDLARKDELLTLLHSESVKANVAPEFHGDDGTTIELSQPVIDMINNILEQAYLPFLVDVVIDNGYRKKGDK
jgi:hypothetical protein